MRLIRSKAWFRATYSGVVTEEDGEQHKLPDESSDGGEHPDQQHQPDLPHRPQDQQDVGKPVPEYWSSWSSV